MAAWNPERSLMPPEGQPQPFHWDASGEAQRAIEERVRTLRSHPLPEPTLRSLRLWFRTQHVYHSNAIEGSTLTLYETQVVIGDGLTVGGKPLRDVLAAKNLADALDWVEAIGQRQEPITERTVREIHALVMRGEDEVLPGQYKAENNLVAGATFRAPSFLQTAPLMQALGSYLSGVHDSDPVSSSAVAHAWMVGIHPFRDGNGRTARLLANLLLIRSGFPVALLTEDRRPAYYAALDKAHCTGDLSDFIALWRDCVATTLEEYERLGGAVQARERDIEYLADLVNSSRSTAEQHLQQWSAAIESLADELRLAASSLNQRLGPTSGRVEVSTSQLTESLMAQARNGMAPVIRLSGVFHAGAFSSDISLGRTDGPNTGLAILLPWMDAPSGKDKLVRLRLDGPRLTLVWSHAQGDEWEEAGKTFTEAASLIFKQALERTTGLS